MLATFCVILFNFCDFRICRNSCNLCKFVQVLCKVVCSFWANLCKFVQVCSCCSCLCMFVQLLCNLLCNFCASFVHIASVVQVCASFVQVFCNMWFFLYFSFFLMIFNDFFESCEKVAEKSWKSRGKDARGISEDEERCRQLFLKSNRHILGKCCACFMQVFSKGDFLHVVCKFVHVLCKNGKNVASMVSACFYQNDGGFRIFIKL